MTRRYERFRPGALLLALTIAVFLWSVAHGVSSIERAYDVSVELHALGDEIVVTDQTPDAINVRIMGSQAALRNIDPDKLAYLLDVSGSKPGDADFEVDVSRISLPRGARIVSRSPSRIHLRFEARGRKAVGVRVDVSGEPAPGFVLEGVDVVPKHVWLTGARSQVLRLREVVTEAVDVTGLKESAEQDVSVFLKAENVWLEQSEPVKVVVRIGPRAIAPPSNEINNVTPQRAMEES